MAEILSEHQVSVLFLGILAFGSAVLLPSVYLVATGHLDPGVLVGVTLAATLVSDVTWYVVGRVVPRERIVGSRFLRRQGPRLEGFTGFFRDHGLVILLGSRFLYGCKIAIDLVCGLERMRIARYLVGCLVATSLWLAALLSFGYLIAPAAGESAFLRGASSARVLGLVALACFVALWMLARNLTLRRIERLQSEGSRG